MGDIREFATLHATQQVCFKVTSSSINFKVKSIGNAGITLSKKYGSPPDICIALGSDQFVLFRKSGTNQEKKSVRARNIFTLAEFKSFWISWNGNAVKLGAGGNFKPMLTYNCKLNDIKYVTFLRMKGSHAAVHWQVELPPVITPPPLKPVNSGELNWVPITDDTNVLPDGCLIGGYEKEVLYITRAKHRGSLTPGKFVPSEGVAYISWGGEAHNKEQFEVLCGYDCSWVPTCEDTIPFGAVVAGHSEDIEHEKLYVGRAIHLGHIIPGKVQPSHRVCYIPYEGKEIAFKNYEILVVHNDDKFYMNTENRGSFHVDSDTEDEDNDGESYGFAPHENRHFFNAFDLF